MATGVANDSSPFLFGYRSKLVVLEQSFLPLSRLLSMMARVEKLPREERRRGEKKLKDEGGGLEKREVSKPLERWKILFSKISLVN